MQKLFIFVLKLLLCTIIDLFKLGFLKYILGDRPTNYVVKQNHL